MEVFFSLLCANSEAKPVLQHAQLVISPLYTIVALFQNLLKWLFHLLSIFQLQVIYLGANLRPKTLSLSGEFHKQSSTTTRTYIQLY